MVDGHIGGLLGAAEALGDFVAVEAVEQPKEDKAVALALKVAEEGLLKLVGEKLGVCGGSGFEGGVERAARGLKVVEGGEASALASEACDVGEHHVLGDFPHPGEDGALGGVVGVGACPSVRGDDAGHILKVCLAEKVGEYAFDVAAHGGGGVVPKLLLGNS